MAATFNAFEFLKSSGELPANPSKKNKKNKSKNKAQSKSEAEQNGNSTPTAPEGAVKSVPNDVIVVDEVQLLERLAKQSESGAGRAKLWKDWTTQALDEQKGAEFKQTFLRSRALELTLESCLKSPLTSAQETLLQQLLITFLPSGDGFVTQRLFSGLLKLSSALDSDAAPDVKSLALHSIHQLTAWLKSKSANDASDAPNDVDSWLARINDLDKNLLQKQGSLKIIGPTVGKEHVACAWQMLKLQEQKVDLLKPGAIPSGTTSTPAPPALIACFQNLREAIGTHMQQEAHGNGNSAYGFERQQMLTAYQREEAVLQQRASQLNAQVKQLEAQLKSLRSEAEEVADKLSQVHKLQSSAKSSAPGSRPPVQQLGLPLASAHKALQAAESLSGLVDGTGNESAETQLLAMQQAQGSAPVDYTGLAKSYLAMNLALLSELPQKVEFCKQRIARAEKMMALSGSSIKILETNRKQKEESEKLREDTLKWAAEAVDNTKEVVRNLNDRYPTLLSVAPGQAETLSRELEAIDDLVLRIQQQYRLVTTAVHTPVAATPVAQHTRPAAPAAAVAAAPVPSNPLPQFAANLNLGTSIHGPGAPAAALPVGTKPEPVAAAQPAPAKPQPVAESNGAPAPRPVSRSWGKVEAVATPPPEGDEFLPTLAEAAAQGNKQGRRKRV